MRKGNYYWAAAALAAAATASLAAGLSRRARTIELSGRVVMISGGSRGLGLAIAREGARRGARLVVLARDEVELERARAELAAGGADVMAVRCDVTDRADVREAVRRAVDRFRHVDVLVNDAGVIEVGPVEEMTEDDFELAMATHFEGPLHLAYQVAAQMAGAGEGRIVNVASVGGLVPVPHLAPYCASKFALVGLSETLRVELAKDGVVVTTVCPGLMRTGSGRAALLRGNVRAENAWFRASALAPLLSMSAEKAARKILDACERGRGLVVLGAPAKLAAFAYRLMPNVTAGLLSAVARALPSATADGEKGAVRGSEISMRPSWLQRVDDRYALENNEGPRRPG